MQKNLSATIDWNKDQSSLVLSGDWTVTHLHRVESRCQRLINRAEKINTIDASQIEQMDSAGALLVLEMVRCTEEDGIVPQLIGLSSHHAALVDLVKEQPHELETITVEKKPSQLLYVLGEKTIGKVHEALDFLAFMGELILESLNNVFKPHRFPYQQILSAIEDGGYRALPIVGLMMFLVGITLAYQLGDQLRDYGADVFIVDFTGIAIFREFGPLITAIIMAGRTSTAYAALLGTMKVNEEIDALRTMGVSPMGRLVLPKVFGLLIAMPLLVVWANIFGIFGGMVMAKILFNISYLGFLERFRDFVEMKHFFLGLIKTPVFALIIAGVGCFHGFQVGTTAESVGHHTTKAAVQTIFLIIVADAAFSIIFSLMNL